jgi:hypothetical protein
MLDFFLSNEVVNKMSKKIFIGVGSLLLVFLIYVASRPNSFQYERSSLINVTPEHIYPYLTNFKLGGKWSPYERLDPQMKKIYQGPAAGVGAKIIFVGNKYVGSGQLEILREVPYSLVEIRLLMTKPFAVSNISELLGPKRTELLGRNSHFDLSFLTILWCNSHLSTRTFITSTPNIFSFAPKNSKI